MYYPSTWQLAFPVDVHIFCLYVYAGSGWFVSIITASTAT